MELIIGLVLIMATAAGASWWLAAKRAGEPTHSAGAGVAGAGAAASPIEIGVAEASRRRAAGAFVLDVRQPEEWREVHIPGATLIPLGELAERVSEVPRDREIVVVCRSGNRSQAGRDILRRAGYSTVTSMAGGVRDWAAAGLPTAKGE